MPLIMIKSMHLAPFEFRVLGKVELTMGGEPKLILTIEIPNFEVAKRYAPGIHPARNSTIDMSVAIKTFEIPVTSHDLDLDAEGWESGVPADLADALISRMLEGDLELPKPPHRPPETKAEFVLKCARELWVLDPNTGLQYFDRKTQTELARKLGYEPGYLAKRRKVHRISTHKELLDEAYSRKSLQPCGKRDKLS